MHLHRKHFDEALAFIEKNFMRQIKLQEAASQAAMSPAYFSTVFKLVKGMNFVDYLNSLRMERAVSLLTEEPPLSVEQISELVGFNHIPHFYRMFKRQTGLTPAQFRRKGMNSGPDKERTAR